MLNWPTAIVIMWVLGVAYAAFSNWIDRKKPPATHCRRCLKELGEEALARENEARTRTTGLYDGRS